MIPPKGCYMQPSYLLDMRIYLKSAQPHEGHPSTSSGRAERREPTVRGKPVEPGHCWMIQQAFRMAPVKQERSDA